MFPPGPGATPAPDAPPDASAAPPSLQQSLNTVPLTPDDLADWWKRIEAAKQRTKDREGRWDALLNEYVPEVNEQPRAEDVKVNAHFRNIHTKMGQLFVRSPKVILQPKGPAFDAVQTIDPMTMQPKIVSASDAVL